jgi:hypothetical protein
VAGVTQLYARISDGTVYALTPTSTLSAGDFVGNSWFFSQGT